MPLKYYGIFTAYPPTADLRAEGLGRQLAEMLKAAARRSDLRFVLACPSWSRQAILDLCKSEGVRRDSFDILSPRRQPISLGLYRALVILPKPSSVNSIVGNLKKSTPFKSRVKRVGKKLIAASARYFKQILRRIICARNPLVFLAISLYALLVGMVLAIFVLPFVLAFAVYGMFWRLWRIDYLHHKLRLLNQRFSKNAAVNQFKLFTLLLRVIGSGGFRIKARLFGMLEESEIDLLIRQINALDHVSAWYSPTAFWPGFNRIKAPHLMCVPDFMPGEFPVGFALSAQSWHLPETCLSMEKAIRESGHLVAYSDHIKSNVLGDRFGVDLTKVHVVRHAANDLAPAISVADLGDMEAVGYNYCKTLVEQELIRAGKGSFVSFNTGFSFRFIFYASQFRPSKNVMTLLRAYEYLLRRRFVSFKLILTGNPRLQPEVEDFIHRYRLGMDVLFLHGMPLRSLAACYRMAELVVNPSLSEGACPFTLTEALSVGTPVVMSRIPVTEEIVTEPDLQAMMLFDGYDWKDMAERIEWALANREALLTRQQLLYRKLKLRSWDNVVDEYVAILDRISNPPAAVAQPLAEKFLLKEAG